MFKWLAERWADNDSLPEKVDIIAVISYAATTIDLTNGSREVSKLAKELAEQYPMARVLWGSFPKNPGGEKIEKEVKSSLFPDGLYVGPVTSSTGECQTMLQRATETGIRTQDVVVVAEGAHSRRCKRVWEYLLPNTNIYFRSVPACIASDPGNPMWFQRDWRVWLLVNIAADCLAYQWKPILRFLIKRNFSQPTRSSSR